MGLIDNSSILMSIKKLLNVEHDEQGFDTDIGMLINGEFMTLHQLGIGPAEGFSITDADTKWTDYSTDKTLLETVKMYVYLKVRMIFDPPASSVVADAINSRINELEFRLNVQAERNQEQKTEGSSIRYKIEGDNMILKPAEDIEQQSVPEPESPTISSLSMSTEVTSFPESGIHDDSIIDNPDPFEDNPGQIENQNDNQPAYEVHGESLRLFRNIF